MTATADYIRPHALDEALEALASDTWIIAAGCTDLFPATERKLLPGPVLDLSAISDLRGIKVEPDGVWIGATTTWRDILQADLPACFDGLKLAAREVGAKQIQNRGTLAGNLCNASPAADGVPPLLTLDAQVQLQSRNSKRRLSLADFLQGPRQTVKHHDELVSGVFVPNSALAGVSGFKKLGARTYLVISIVSCAARLVEENGKIATASLSVGSCSPVAVRLSEVEHALVGQPITQANVDPDMVRACLSPIDDPRADAGYRAQAAADLMNDVLQELSEGHA